MRWIAWTFWLIATLAGQASAAPIAFDCDVPADRFSSVTGNPVVRGQISGSVDIVELRKGNYLPVAGVRLTSLDETQSVGFQLASKGRNAFDVVLNVNDGTGLKRASVGELSVNGAIAFSLKAADSGDITLEVAGQSYRHTATAMALSTATVFCSTGQFKFSGLQI